MATYNVRNFQDYMAAQKEINKAKECGYSLEIHKAHPKASGKQLAYLNFCLSYYSLKVGQPFNSTLRELQESVCPMVFDTGERDHQGYPRYKKLFQLNTAEMSSAIRNFLDFASSREVMIPEKDDQEALAFCQRELESAGAGWI